MKETIWGMSPEWGAILIPTIASIIVFVLGIIIQFIGKSYERERKRSNLKSIILGWIDELSTSFTDYCNSIDDFANQVKRQEDLNPEALKLSRLPINKLEEISLVDVMDVFNSKTDIKNKKPYNFVSSIEYLKSVQVEIRNEYNKYHIRCLDIMKKWNSAFIQLQQEIIQQHKNKDPDTPDYKLYVFFFKTVQMISEEDVGKVALSKYDRLIIELFEKLSKQDIDDTDDTIKTKLKDCYFIIREFESNKGTSIVFENYSTDIKECITKLSAKKLIKVDREAYCSYIRNRFLKTNFYKFTMSLIKIICKWINSNSKTLISSTIILFIWFAYKPKITSLFDKYIWLFSKIWLIVL